jgi:hypothetical protein
LYDADGQLLTANASILVGNGYDYDPNGNRIDTTADFALSSFGFD